MQYYQPRLGQYVDMKAYLIRPYFSAMYLRSSDLHHSRKMSLCTLTRLLSSKSFRNNSQMFREQAQHLVVLERFLTIRLHPLALSRRLDMAVSGLYVLLVTVGSSVKGQKQPGRSQAERQHIKSLFWHIRFYKQDALAERK